MSTVEYAIQELLGCCWGRKLWDPEDQSPCPEKADRIIVLHHKGDEQAFKFCDRHAATVMLLTDPHQESVESSTPNLEGPPL